MVIILLRLIILNVCYHILFFNQNYFSFHTKKTFEFLIKILSIKFKICKKKLFIGIYKVFDVTPSEFKKTKHSILP